MGSTLPYWQVNVPLSQREATCPTFLANCNEKDIGILSTPDADYKIQSWPSVRETISANRLDLFQRLPSDLRRYLQYTHSLKQQYGSVMNFVLSQRLHWREPLTPRGKPFECEEDVKILWNDWPYGIDEKIVHLVVWTKFELLDDEKTGDLTDAARGQIEEYVRKTFRDKVGSENVIWFKNWKVLKSVHAVEHFHVMLYDPDLDFVKEITNGDIPLSKKI